MPKTKTSKAPDFKVGDRVTWSSQAAGSWKEKTGVITQAPEIGNSFMENGRAMIRQASPRHRYQVRVEWLGKRGVRSEFYYPSTSALTLATDPT